MTYKNTVIRNLMFGIAVFLIAMLVACSPVKQTATPATALIQNIQTTVTPIPKSTATTVLTSTKMPTVLPTVPPTMTKTTTPQSTVPPLQQIEELPVNGSSVAVTNDGSLVAAVNGQNGTVYVYDMVMQNIKWTFIDNATMGDIVLDFSPDNTLLVTGGALEQDVFVWDMNTGELVITIPTSDLDKVTQVSFSTDSQLLAVSASMQQLRIYSVATGELVDKLPSSNIIIYPESDNDIHPLRPHSASGWFLGEAIFVPRHPKLLAVSIHVPHAYDSGMMSYLYFWDMESQQLQEALSISTPIIDDTMAISPNGQLLVLAEDRLWGWDIQNELEFSPQYTEDIGDTHLRRMALTDTGVLAVLSQELIDKDQYMTILNSVGVVTIWNHEGKLASMSESDKFITDITFMPDGNLLVAGYLNGEVFPVEIWEITE